jgi:glucose-6-phosphate isomerase
MIELELDGADGLADDIRVEAAREAWKKATALPMSGWTKLPVETMRELPRLTDSGKRIAGNSDALVVIGAGGSSLGARALTEAIPRCGGVREVYFAGDNLSGAYMSRLLGTLEGREISVVATSKSGTTAEPAAALRVFVKLLRDRYGENFGGRLHIVAGEKASALREFAVMHGCGLYDIPEDTGGRYSALTAAGLLPAAARGIDIGEVLRGARDQAGSGLEAALRYATARQSLYSKGCRTEIFATFEPSARALGEWWKQLFGESEGKGGGGIFPATAGFTGDLHSMGQYIQEGRRDIFETIVYFRENPGGAEIPDIPELGDGLGFLGGTRPDEANAIAREAVKAAHVAGGVPVVGISAPRQDEASLGALIYFFECACAVSACIAGVNPFDQPGVEAYKRIMLEKLRERGGETRAE